MGATTVKPLSKDLGEEFLAHLYALPEGKKVRECLQCGTCSASCPSSHAMEYGPREIIAALRARMLDRVVGSNTMWLCVSCYFCSVRCPAGIPFTDLMYELKRLGVKSGVDSAGTRSAAMARAFVKTVDRRGRNIEAELLRRYFLSTNPLEAFGLVPLVLRLARRGRLKLGGKPIRGIQGLRKMMEAIEEENGR